MTATSLLDPDHPAVRLWVLITGLAGFFAGIGAYRHPLSPHKTLYRGTTDTANATFARMYATWLFTSSIIRFSFFVVSHVQVGSALFWMPFMTYVIAAFHFVSEICFFNSVSLKPGGFAPLCVAAFSILWFLAMAFLGAPSYT